LRSTFGSRWPNPERSLWSVGRDKPTFVHGDCQRECYRDLKISTTDGLRSGPNACDQDVDQIFGSPLAIGSQAYVRDTGERAQQVERIKIQMNVAARDRANRLTSQLPALLAP